MPFFAKPKYCPRCGNDQLQPYERDHYQCQTCQFIMFKNPIPANCAIIIKDSQLLYAKRAREPRKGCWDFPGGFVEIKESGEAATIRECQEELGVKVRVLNYICSLNDRYYNQGFDDLVLNLYYACEIISGKPKPSDDVSEIKWFPIDQPPDQIAFEHMRTALPIIQRYHKKQRK